MSYTPPGSTSVAINLTDAYTPPVSTAVSINFTDAGAPVINYANPISPSAQFGTPLGLHTGIRATGMAPTVVFGTPRGAPSQTQSATGFTSTHFGLPIRDRAPQTVQANGQAQTATFGLANTWTPRFVQAAGNRFSVFGTPGMPHITVAQHATVFGTPKIPVAATGFKASQFGTAKITLRARGWLASVFGQAQISNGATGWRVPVFGQPKVILVQSAGSLRSIAFGIPDSMKVFRASAFGPTAKFPANPLHAIYLQIQGASSFNPTHFGLDELWNNPVPPYQANVFMRERNFVSNGRSAGVSIFRKDSPISVVDKKQAHTTYTKLQ